MKVDSAEEPRTQTPGSFWIPRSLAKARRGEASLAPATMPFEAWGSSAETKVETGARGPEGNPPLRTDIHFRHQKPVPDDRPHRLIILSLCAYSYRRASIGLRRDACIAG
jgi:hypothetical protein